MITITEKALAHFAKQLLPNHFVLISTKKSGCSGLAYVTEIKEGDTPADAIKLSGALPIFMAKESAEYLHDMVLDYQTQGMQSKLVYINPNEAGRCGCGESFSVARPAS
jgi:iron-sulfur cluster assembly accessory protein